MLASRAFAARSFPMASSGYQIGQLSAPHEATWAMSDSEQVAASAMRHGPSTTSSIAEDGLLRASTEDGDDDETNLDPALRRTQHAQGIPSYGPAPQANSGEVLNPAAAFSVPGGNLGQHQLSLGGNQLKVTPNLTINTRIHLTKAQEIEFAKEKIAHRPAEPLPTDRFSVDQGIGRPPPVLRERIPGPQQDTRNWFSEFTADELLHHMHPDDMCGTIIIEISKQYSGPEIAGFVNELYKLRGGAKGDLSTNGFTKRITLAVKHLCQDSKADRKRVLDALADDRSVYRETGTPGTKAETAIQGIRDRQAAQTSSVAVGAPATQVSQPSGQAVANAPPNLPTFAAPLAQSSNDSNQGPTGTRSAAGCSKCRRSGEAGEAPQPKRAKHDQPDLEGEGSDEDAEFEYEDMM